jgi:Uncharacterized conserved protein (DUF2181)
MIDRVSSRSSTAQAARAQGPDTTWHRGQPLSEARNAHRTNTKEQFQEALKSGANWFEGDVRLEIDGSGIEMRHDTQHESGDNLTLREWLTMGKASGRGLKLDVKEPQHMAEILKTIKEVGIPEERLMLNLGFDAMNTWGAEIRKQFPNAILAINPPTEGKLSAADARRMVEQAKKFGDPVNFVVRYDNLTDEAIREFQKHPGAAISVWGSGVNDVAATTESLKRRGVNGMIDLASGHGKGADDYLKDGFNWVKTGWDKLF